MSVVILLNGLPVDSPSVVASDANNAGCSSTNNADEPFAYVSYPASVVVETMSSAEALFPPILLVVDNQTTVVRKSGRGSIVV